MPDIQLQIDGGAWSDAALDVGATVPGVGASQAVAARARGPVHRSLPANLDAFSGTDITLTPVGVAGMVYAEITDQLAWGTACHRVWQYQVDGAGPWIDLCPRAGLHLIEGLRDGVAQDLRFRTLDNRFQPGAASAPISVTPNDAAVRKTMTPANFGAVLSGLVAGDVVEVEAGTYSGAVPGSGVFDCRNAAFATPVLIMAKNPAPIDAADLEAHPVFHRHILSNSSRMVFQRIVWRPDTDATVTRGTAYNVLTGTATQLIRMQDCRYQGWLSTNASENRNSAEYGGAFIDFTGQPAGVLMRVSGGANRIIFDGCTFDTGKRAFEILQSSNVAIWGGRQGNITGDHHQCRALTGVIFARIEAGDCAAFVPDDDHSDFLQLATVAGEGACTDVGIYDNRNSHDVEKGQQFIFLNNEQRASEGRHGGLHVWGNVFYGAHSNSLYLNGVDGATVGQNVVVRNDQAGTYPSGDDGYPRIKLIDSLNIEVEGNITYAAVQELAPAGPATILSHLALDTGNPDADGSTGLWGINAVFADARPGVGADVGQVDGTIADMRPIAGGIAVSQGYGSEIFRALAT